jgi:hypothetical protein
MPQVVKSVFLIALLACLSAGTNAGIDPVATWERSEAARIAELTDTSPVREDLRRLTLSGSSTELLELLNATAARADWPAPARESVLHDFVQDLRGMPPRSIAPEVMDFLHAYETKVLVAHDDHPRVEVPMFNIRSAAAGVENTWKRQEAAFEGAGLLSQDPVRLIDAYLAGNDPAIRRGLLDSLSVATPGQLEAICFLALAALEDEPAMAGLAGRAALLNTDARALEQLVRNGSGPAISHILRRSTEVLTDRQLIRLLDTAVQEGTSETASIAIAVLAPALAHLPNHAQALIDLLGDPELGSSAALALAKNPSASALRLLDRLASADDDSLTAHRARLALTINRSQFAGEVQE